jgi:hypothetical protein
MTDLAAWLRARLDEDEALAHDALLGYPAAMHVGVGQPVPPPPTPTTPGAEWRSDYQHVQRTDGFRSIAEAAQASAEVAHHIARHDPARVLAEVAAKRALLDEYQHVATRADDPRYEAALRNAVMLLAEVHQAHEDWRPAWKR